MLEKYIKICHNMYTLQKTNMRHPLQQAAAISFVFTLVVAASSSVFTHESVGGFLIESEIPFDDTCFNGVDEDMDGFTDDADCDTIPDDVTIDDPIFDDPCSNGVDEDMDGYPDDADCDTDPSDPTDPVIDDPCSNGVDEDMDGYTDDADCDTDPSDPYDPAMDDSYMDDPYMDDPCSNGVDEDMDGNTDDSDCDTVPDEEFDDFTV
ncbi:hypothetical protein CL635_02625 [bacterium]|nr:hypothetical protein [bacterium]